MKIGVISDTHDHLDPKIFELFAGVDHILHGGDIGMPAIIMDLEAIAPVTAVLGNNDSSSKFRETETVLLAGRKFLIHHIVDVRAPIKDDLYPTEDFGVTRVYFPTGLQKMGGETALRFARTRHTPAALSQSAASTWQPKRICGAMPYSSTTRAR